MRTHKCNKVSPRISPTLPSTALGVLRREEHLKLLSRMNSDLC